MALLASVVWAVIAFCNFIEFQGRRSPPLKEHSSRDATSRWAGPADGQDPKKSREKLDGNEGVRAGLSERDAVRNLPSESSEGLFANLGKSIKDLRKMGREMGVSRDPTFREPLDRLDRDVAEAELDRDVAEVEREVSEWRRRSAADDFQAPIANTKMIIHLDRICKDAKAVEKALREFGTSDQRKKAIETVRYRTNKILLFTFLTHLEIAFWPFLIGMAVFLVFFVGCFGITTHELAKRRLSSKKRFVAFYEFCRFLGGISAVCIIIYLIALSCSLCFLSVYFYFGQSTNDWLSARSTASWTRSTASWTRSSP